MHKIIINVLKDNKHLCLHSILQNVKNDKFWVCSWTGIRSLLGFSIYLVSDQTPLLEYLLSCNRIPCFFSKMEFDPEILRSPYSRTWWKIIIIILRCYFEVFWEYKIILSLSTHSLTKTKCGALQIVFCSTCLKVSEVTDWLKMLISRLFPRWTGSEFQGKAHEPIFLITPYINIAHTELLRVISIF